MITIDKLNNLPDKIKKEVLDYAEYLISKHESGNKNDKLKWADVSNRGTSKGESTSETVLRNREEEKW